MICQTGGGGRGGGGVGLLTQPSSRFLLSSPPLLVAVVSEAAEGLQVGKTDTKIDLHLSGRPGETRTTSEGLDGQLSLIKMK